MRLLELVNLEYSETGTVRSRTGTRMKDVVPRGSYLTCEPDRWIALSGSTPATSRRILHAIGRQDLADDPRLQTNEDRIRHRGLIEDALTEWVGRHTLQEALATFRAADAAAAPIYNAEDILADPHFRARETHVDVPDPHLGSIRMQNVMPRLSRTPGRIQHTAREKGQDNDEVLRDLLGLGREEIAALSAEGAI